MTTTIETNHHADNTRPVPIREHDDDIHSRLMPPVHEFSSVPELNASGRGLDHRLHTSHRVSCSCGAAWTFKTDEIAARVTGNHLRRVSR